MQNKNTYLAIIPARAGSKRLVKKNIRKLIDKPLVSWSIEAAKKSKYISNIVVTSDDDDILDIANNLDVIAFARLAELATDTSTSVDVVVDVIKKIQKEYDYIVLLQPTSPLRKEIHIDEAIELLNEKNASAVVSVCEMEHSPLWSNTLDKTLSMNKFLNKNIINKRGQDLEQYYRLNGAIYICATEKLLDEKSFMLQENIFAYIMDKKDSIDIDEEIDFLLAEAILSAKL